MSLVEGRKVIDVGKRGQAYIHAAVRYGPLVREDSYSGIVDTLVDHRVDRLEAIIAGCIASPRFAEELGIPMRVNEPSRVREDKVSLYIDTPAAAIHQVVGFAVTRGGYGPANPIPSEDIFAVLVDRDTPVRPNPYSPGEVFADKLVHRTGYKGIVIIDQPLGEVIPGGGALRRVMRDPRVSWEERVEEIAQIAHRNFFTDQLYIYGVSGAMYHPHRLTPSLVRHIAAEWRRG